MRVHRTVPMLVALGVIVLTGCGGGGSSGSTEDGRAAARSVTAAVDDPTGAKASPQCAAQVRTLRLDAVSSLADVVKAGAAAMRRAHPDLTIDVVADAPDYPSLAGRIGADRAAGRGVDVAVVGLDTLPTAARALGAQPLSPRVLRASYDQHLLGLGTVDGRLLGIPAQVTSLALVYNLDILGKAGVDPATLSTSDGVLAAAEKIRASGQNVQPIELPTGQQLGQWILATLAGSRGTPIQDAAGRPALNTATTRDAAAFLAKAGSYGTQSENPTEALLRFGLRRQTAMIAMDAATLAGALKFIAGRGEQGFRVGASVFPSLPGGSRHPVALGSALSVLATDRCQREMATELVVTVLSPEIVAAGTQASSSIPVDTAAVDQLGTFYATYPQLRPFLALTGSLIRPPAWAGTRGAQEPAALSAQVARILRGENPAQTLAAAQTEAEDLTQ
ncbi:ABC-type sugar transport system, periplasmic component [Frankia sp. AiPs1]|uniref:extracellular solute-binding protein n=1 Tax=Frankia sp. AiPa1 TaxID=573492 RepID=UPI0035A855D6